MGMFDELEGFMADNRKPKKATDSSNRDGDGIFDDLQKPEEQNERSGSEHAREIAKMLEEKFGGKTQIIGEGMVSHEIRSETGGGHKVINRNMERLREKMDLMGRSMMFGLKSIGSKGHCNDANGKALKEGDILKVPGNKQKKVLELGFGFIFLSHTDDLDKDDGLWFEKEIKDRGFTKE